jgi:indoleamine 2,3-dioxygenase
MQLPLVELPKEYAEMEKLLQDMPIIKADGSHGLLHYGTFGDELMSRLPQYDLSKVTDSVCLCNRRHIARVGL